MIQSDKLNKSAPITFSKMSSSYIQESAAPSSPQMKSQSIPITKNIFRTASEIQLCLDEQIADQRDYAFFSRLVNGISRTRNSSQNRQLQFENHMCLSHVVKTRHDEKDESSQLGLSIDAPVDRSYVHSIANEALDVATSGEEGIFELEL